MPVLTPPAKSACCTSAGVLYRHAVQWYLLHTLTALLTLDHLIKAMQMLCPCTYSIRVSAVFCDPFKVSALLCSRPEVTALCC